MAWTNLKAFVEAFESDPSILTTYVKRHAKWKFAEDLIPIINAYWIYKRSMTAAKGYVLLGDSSIRTDMAMIWQHGLLSGSGVQEPETRAFLTLIKLRQRVPGPLVGVGSILSDSSWSPLLNDAMIIGGAHGHRQFQLRKDPEARTGPPVVANLKMQFEVGLTSGQKSWVDHFNKNQDLLWAPRGPIPRVLAREILGLSTFGYKPTCADAQITFTAGQASHAARFQTYLNALQRAGAFAEDRQTALGAISNYLFGSPKLLK